MKASKKFSVRFLTAAAVFSTGWSVVSAVESPAPRPPQPTFVNRVSFRQEIQHSIDLGLGYLEKAQAGEGHWSNPEYPALSGMAITALQGDPDESARSRESRRKTVSRGYDFLLRCVQKDGGIYSDRKLVNYNTSVCMVALLLAGKPEYDPVIRKARQLIISRQLDLGVPGKTDGVLDGGMGYGDGSAHADLVNTMHTLEALYYSRRLARDRAPDVGQDLNWDAAIQFIQNCQHLASVNKQSWVSDKDDQRGGFIYSPGESKAGELKSADGRSALSAYASISYAGMLSYVYAGLRKDDPRVVAVVDWTRRNYTLDENPGMGPQGLYFYFHTLTKALTAAGHDSVETADGVRHDWRVDLGLHLMNLQKSGGSWENDNARWWEKDAVLSTSYAVISMEMIHRSLKP